ncbi:MAG: hypothetical protein JETT_1413 [Candidatus Jettenia ecosi]|uniref:Uncharacterized protein n=1 Tax=Candidatus Jettenia ecosi TaxID=2494326 RepID=A0A533QC56_9BACT|nr:MAG: hypothetical protein JETT_1413 [Candidatus Jettenia ecosi]
MKPVSENELDDLLNILEKHEQELKAFEGVHYVDVGYKFKDGNPIDDILSIRAHVLEKKKLDELDPSQVIPPRIEEILTDVIQSNPEIPFLSKEAANNLKETATNWLVSNKLFDPLRGGIAVWNPRYAFPGTLGMIVFDARTSEPLGLSNHHVFVREQGKQGDPIKQGNINMDPPEPDAVTVVGTLIRSDEGLDCAVCTFNNTRKISKEILRYSQKPTGVRRPLLGMHVTKSGIASGVTYGTIDGVGLRGFTVIPDPARPSPNGEISMGGDSGSVWLDVASFKAVGLHFAGERDPSPRAERAWANQMVKVAKALDIVFG